MVEDSHLAQYTQEKGRLEEVSEFASGKVANCNERKSVPLTDMKVMHKWVTRIPVVSAARQVPSRDKPSEPGVLAVPRIRHVCKQEG